MIGRMPICYEDIAMFYAISECLQLYNSSGVLQVFGCKNWREPSMTVNVISESISSHMCCLSDLTYGSFVNVIII